MPGQAIITIEDRKWVVDVACTFFDLAQGLGGLPELPPGTGMLFDTGFEQTIEVTTMPMLFPLDIAFLSDDLLVTEVYHSIKPGYFITSRVPARYFLEVNADELEDIEPGTSGSIEYLVTEGVTPATSDLVLDVMPFVGFLVLGAITTTVVRDMVKSDFGH